MCAALARPGHPIRGGSVGSLDWMQCTGGRLSGRDRAILLRQGVAFQVGEIAGWLATRVFARRPLNFDLTAIRVPDTPVAHEAEEVCRSMRPEMLVAHSLRTYMWAAGLAAACEVAVDEEVLYVSSLLHDLGLSVPHQPEDRGVCFTRVGADAASRLSWSQPRAAAAAAEAITLHMNLRVPIDSPEAHFMAAGTQLDAIGAGKWRLAPTTVASVLAVYPRDEVKSQMVELFRHQKRDAPGTRAHFYWRYLNLRLRLKYAPFPS